jgi:Tol biopolymer transport system component
MKHNLLLVCLLLAPAAVYGGIKSAGAPLKLAGDEIDPLCSPVWSPDGETIACTTPHFAGIWLMRPDGSDLRQISDESGAGFGLQWSADSRAILARVSATQGGKRLHALKLFDLELQRDTLLTPFQTGIVSLPRWSTDGTEILVSINNKLKRLASGMTPKSLQRKPMLPLWYLNADRVMKLSPAADDAVQALPAALSNRPVFNLVQSSDGALVAFQILGGPLCVMRSDGTGLVELGEGEAPSFSPDGTFIAYMVTRDDGHTITDSDIYVSAVDGTGKINLTQTEGRSEMHPSWSPRGNALLYDLYETGEIWSLPVTMDETQE